MGYRLQGCVYPGGISLKRETRVDFESYFFSFFFSCWPPIQTHDKLIRASPAVISVPLSPPAHLYTALLDRMVMGNQ